MNQKTVKIAALDNELDFMRSSLAAIGQQRDLLLSDLNRLNKRKQEEKVLKSFFFFLNSIKSIANFVDSLQNTIADTTNQLADSEMRVEQLIEQKHGVFQQVRK